MTRTVRTLRRFAAVILTACLTVSVTAPAVAQGDDGLLEEMIALEQSKLDPWFQNDVSAYVAEIGDQTTYFDPNMGERLIGEEVREFFSTVYGGNIPPIDYALTDPSVAVRDDIVVFTFHIDMSDPTSGDPLGRWMVSKVLERTDDGWGVIHGHFGLPAQPAAEPPAG